MKIKDVNLNIIYRFEDYEFIVFASDKCFYQLPHFAKRTKIFRKLNVKLHGNCESISFNRKPIPLSELRRKKIKVFEFLKIYEEVECPF